MKYVSLDLETTGLDPLDHQITEFAVVVDDLTTCQPIESLPAIHGYVEHREDLIWNMHALLMFKNRLEEYHVAEKVKVDELVQVILNFLPAFIIKDYVKKCKDPDFNVTPKFSSQTEMEKTRITFAGKNFASFDKGFLANLPNADRLLRVMHHRSFDPGSLYFDPRVDAVIPATATCMERAGIKGPVTHRALDDARNVVRLIRTHYKLAV